MTSNTTTTTTTTTAATTSAAGAGGVPSARLLKTLESLRSGLFVPPSQTANNNTNSSRGSPTQLSSPAQQQQQQQQQFVAGKKPDAQLRNIDSRDALLYVSNAKIEISAFQSRISSLLGTLSIVESVLATASGSNSIPTAQANALQLHLENVISQLGDVIKVYNTGPQQQQQLHADAQRMATTVSNHLARIAPSRRDQVLDELWNAVNHVLNPPSALSMKPFGGSSASSSAQSGRIVSNSVGSAQHQPPSTGKNLGISPLHATTPIAPRTSSAATSVPNTGGGAYTPMSFATPMGSNSVQTTPASLDGRTPRRVSCGICHLKGHNSRSCQENECKNENCTHPEHQNDTDAAHATPAKKRGRPRSLKRQRLDEQEAEDNGDDSVSVSNAGNLQPIGEDSDKHMSPTSSQSSPNGHSVSGTAGQPTEAMVSVSAANSNTSALVSPTLSSNTTASNPEQISGFAVPSIPVSNGCEKMDIDTIDEDESAVVSSDHESSPSVTSTPSAVEHNQQQSAESEANHLPQPVPQPQSRQQLPQIRLPAPNRPLQQQTEQQQQQTQQSQQPQQGLPQPVSQDPASSPEPSQHPNQHLG
ncbi:hypothetical protein GQ42DRAFT_177246 [Ramicandelaber brevisporus]|nr:hypothetical protein GQ42DRAFT_177246 [Ramicandelaber brevisporus]